MVAVDEAVAANGLFALSVPSINSTPAPSSNFAPVTGIGVGTGCGAASPIVRANVSATGWAAGLVES